MVVVVIVLWPVTLLGHVKWCNIRGVATIEAVEAAASVNLLTSDLLEID